MSGSAWCVSWSVQQCSVVLANRVGGCMLSSERLLYQNSSSHCSKLILLALLAVKELAHTCLVPRTQHNSCAGSSLPAVGSEARG